jgi:ABC-type multidrug transport system fused ATPase/permease subunit
MRVLKIVLMGMIAAFANLVSLGLRISIGNYIDMVFGNEDYLFYLIPLVGLAILCVLFNFLIPALKVTIKTRIETSLWSQLEKKVVNMNQCELEKKNRENLTTLYISDVEGIVMAVENFVFKFFPDAISFIVLCCFICRLNVELGIIVVASTFVPMLVMFIVSKVILKKNSVYQKAVESVHSVVLEGCSNLEMIKSLCVENVFRYQNKKQLNEQQKIKKEMNLWEGLLSVPAMLTSFVTLLVSASYGTVLVIQNNITLGNFFVLVTAIDYIISPIMSLDTYLSNIQKWKSHRKRIFTIINDVEAVEAEEEYEKVVVNQLEVKNVDFEYPDGTNIYENLNVCFEKGKINLIIGENGCGKTTLLKILMGVYGLQKGIVLLNGKVVDNVKLIGNLSSVATQDFLILRGTIMDNLLCGDKKITSDKVKEISIRTGFYADVEKMQDGYNTILEERGRPLSEGQKQKLNVTRTLLKNKEIYFFDEPTEFLDINSKNTILKVLEELSQEKLVVIISHDKEIKKIANNISIIGVGEDVDK